MKKFVIRLIRMYQKYLSPLKDTMALYLYSDLFPVWDRGDRKIWSVKGRTFDCMEDFTL